MSGNRSRRSAGWGLNRGRCAFQNPYDPTNTWSCANGPTLPCVYDSTNRARLFLPINYSRSGSWPSYENVSRGYISYTLVHLTGLIGRGVSRVEARGPAQLRQAVDFCLSADGVTCATNVLQKTFTTSSADYSVGGTTLGWTDWSPNLSVDHVRIAQKTGTVANSSGVLTLRDGDHFVPPYANGTPIYLSGTGCKGFFTMSGAPSDTDSKITLSSDPGCSGAVPYTLTPFGLLVWADTTTLESLSISAATFDYGIDYEPQTDSSPSQNAFNQVGGPPITVGTCPGYLANFFTGWYYLCPAQGIVNYLGQWMDPGGNNIPYGLEVAFGAAVIDPVTPGTITYLEPGPGGKTKLMKAVYSGSYSASLPPGTQPPPCGISPCLTFTTLEADIVSKFATFSPQYAADCCTPAGAIIIAGGCPDGMIVMQVPLAGQQGVAGWYVVYNPFTTSFVAARRTTDWYPITGTGFHSIIPRCGAGQTIGVGQQTSGGLGLFQTATSQFSGTGAFPSVGPYLTKIPGGLPSSGTVACPAEAAGSPIAPIDYPGGRNNTGVICSSIALANNEWENPAPYAVTVTATVADGSPNVSLSAPQAVPQFAGKPFVAGGSTYVITAVIDQSHFILSANFSGPACTSSCSGTVQAEPPCSFTGASCYNPMNSALRPLRMGYKAFVRYPTSGVTVPQYRNNNLNLMASSEAIMVISIGADCAGNPGSANACVQRNYAGKSKVGNWAFPTYLAMDSGVYDYFTDGCGLSCDWDPIWPAASNPDGSQVATHPDQIDYAPPQGHSTLTSAYSGGFYNSCPGFSTLQWNGARVTNCYQSRFGPDYAYIGKSSVSSAMSAPFNGQPLGIGDPNDVDTHPSYTYLLNPTWFADARPMNGSTSAPSPGSPVTGTLYKFTYAQRGFPSAAAAILSDKYLPTVANCGHHPMLNISGPSATIGGSVSNYYEYLTVLKANEGVPGSSPGDLYTNCPGASVIGGNSPPIGQNGGDIIDISVAPSGAWQSGIVQVDFSTPVSDGSHTRWLGHQLTQPRWYSAFWNVRTTPDGLGMTSQTFGVDSSKTQVLMTLIPPIQYDSLSRTGFIMTPVSVPANPAYSFAQVEFGYAENGNPANGLYCTPRADSCETNANYPANGDPFYYASQPQAPTACAHGCTINVPAIPTRTLYVRPRYTDAAGVTQSALPVQAIAIP